MLLLGAGCAYAVATATPPPPAQPTPAVTALPPPPGVPLTQIVVGKGYRCGLRVDGVVVCQGQNAEEWPPGFLPGMFRQITAGQSYVCGLRIDGTIACQGEQVKPPFGSFMEVAAGKQHACALDAAGSVNCWGWDQDGRATAPADIRFETIAAGGSHSCGLTDAGALRCWGANRHGQGEAADGPFQALALGLRHTCGLQADGSVWCQGDDREGQSSPPEGSFTQITAGERFTCGLRADRRPECWGGGFAEGLAVPEGEFTVISAGWEEVCGLRINGIPECWGYRPGAREPVALPPPGGNFTLDIRRPVELFSWPGGGLAVAEQTGSVAWCHPGKESPCEKGVAPLLLDLGAEVDLTYSERGLLSAALDPKFAEFPYLYVYYTVKGAEKLARLSRFTVVDGAAEKGTELAILETPLPGRRHYGGAVRFGPEGMLYLGVGDNGFAEPAQDLTTLQGKIIRIDVRGATVEEPYRIPEDNPFLETPGARPELWAYGLRNPWRMSFDQAGRLWVGDVGELSREEVSIATAGANLGWPAYEGEICRDEEGCAAQADAALPVITYGRDEGCAIIWGGEYQGKELRQLAGAYLFGDYCTGRVWALTEYPTGVWQRWLVADTDGSLLAFGFDAAGEMYLLTFNAPIRKLEAVLLAAGD